MEPIDPSIEEDSRFVIRGRKNFQITPRRRFSIPWIDFESISSFSKGTESLFPTSPQNQDSDTLEPTGSPLTSSSFELPATDDSPYFAHLNASKQNPLSRHRSKSFRVAKRKTPLILQSPTLDSNFSQEDTENQECWSETFSASYSLANTFTNNRARPKSESFTDSLLNRAEFDNVSFQTNPIPKQLNFESHLANPPTNLPTVKVGGSSSQFISSSVLVDILKGNYGLQYDECIIIDCRFPYEYNGGHIQGALNLFREEDVTKMFFSNPIIGKRICIIFHCEFSSKRGPKMCQHLRSVDRAVHLENYPELYYPEVYVLEGGYKSFFESHMDYCDPKSYVLMTDQRYADEYKSCIAPVRKDWKRSKSWGDVHLFEKFKASSKLIRCKTQIGGELSRENRLFFDTTIHQEETTTAPATEKPESDESQ